MSPRPGGDQRARPGISVRVAAAEELAVGDRGAAEHQDVDADAGHDLVGAQRDAEPGLQQRHRQHREQPRSPGPSIGLPVAQAPIAPAKAPISIMPSTLMLSTPARSLTSSPVRREHQGHRQAQARADEHRGHLVGHRVAFLAAVDPEGGAGEHQDDQALDHQHDRARHAGLELHVDAARAQEAEQQRARPARPAPSRGRAGRRRGRRSRSPTRTAPSGCPARPAA